MKSVLPLLAVAAVAACEAPFGFPAQVVAIRITPDTVSLQAGDSVLLSAEATDSNGRPLSGVRFAWSSSVDSIAAVTPQGLVRSATSGVVVISASAGNVQGRANVAVSPRVAAISIDQGAVTTVPGGTVAFTTHAVDPHGNTFVSPLLAFSSTDTSVFSVSATGVVHARAPGRAELVAAFGTIQGTAAIRVDAATFVSVSAGEADHTCGVTVDSLAFCWGANDIGQLAVPSLTHSSAPITAPYGHSFTAIHAGATFTCGETGSDGPYCWGSNFRSRLGVGANPAASVTPLPVYNGQSLEGLSTGWNDACAFTGPTMYCWGENPGAGGTAPIAYIPTAVTLDSTLVTVDVSVGFACGLTTGGTAYCWGLNQFGQLGDSSSNDQDPPSLVAGGLKFTQVVGGNAHACGLTGAGDAYCWGSNASGQLGTGDTSSSRVPRLVVTALTFHGIDAGGTQTCGLAADSSAYCWGNGHTAPALISGGLHFRTLTVGNQHVCALATDGRAYCWGGNDAGQLGDGTFTDRATPTPVLGQP